MAPLDVKYQTHWIDSTTYLLFFLATSADALRFAPILGQGFDRGLVVILGRSFNAAISFKRHKLIT